MSDEIARVGQLISFEYPKSNHDHVPLRWEHRRFRIDDIDSKPVPQAFIDRDPHLRRLGPRLIGVDLDLGEPRSFYRDAARRMFAIEQGTKVARADEREHLDSVPVTEAGESEVAMHERLFRIVIVAKDGTERIAYPCLRERDATIYVAGYNKISDAWGLHAIAREVELPRLKRNLPRQIE